MSLWHVWLRSPVGSPLVFLSVCYVEPWHFRACLPSHHRRGWNMNVIARGCTCYRRKQGLMWNLALCAFASRPQGKGNWRFKWGQPHMATKKKKKQKPLQTKPQATLTLAWPCGALIPVNTLGPHPHFPSLTPEAEQAKEGFSAPKRHRFS